MANSEIRGSELYFITTYLKYCKNKLNSLARNMKIT